MLKDHQDAFGHEFFDYFNTQGGNREIREIIERDDSYIEVSGGTDVYFQEYKDWPLHQRKAMRYARGRVLDIGCGAGRHSLYLQEKGLEVMGIDNSPLAVKVCKQRGLANTEVMSINQIGRQLGIFDTVIMMGNNFGLFGSFERARRLLEKLNTVTSKNGRIIAETIEVYQTDNPDHLSYHEFNRQRGRMGGQVRIRARYKKYTTPWFDYLMVSKKEMEEILEGTGWRVMKYIESNSPRYIAILEKK